MYYFGPSSQNLDEYRWPDLVKKICRLKTHHLKNLVKFAEKENNLETHDNVSDMIQEQLHREKLEKQQGITRQSRVRLTCPQYSPVIVVASWLF